jgi:hypothetical protein
MANAFQKQQKQQAKRDCYEDVWNLYNVLAEHIATQLRRFLDAEKKCYHSVPNGFRDEREWQAVLRTMIRAFNLLASTSGCPEIRDPHIPEVEQEAIIQEGLRLFSVHFRSLWL